MIYLTFPTEKSVSFPDRGGCLCYYDDTSHTGKPPEFESVIRELEQNNFEIIFSSKSYSPFILRVIGFLLEPYSRYKKHVVMGTWAYYGFEAVIWARKKG